MNLPDFTKKIFFRQFPDEIVGIKLCVCVKFQLVPPHKHIIWLCGCELSSSQIILGHCCACDGKFSFIAGLWLQPDNTSTYMVDLSEENERKFVLIWLLYIIIILYCFHQVSRSYQVCRLF